VYSQWPLPLGVTSECNNNSHCIRFPVVSLGSAYFRYHREDQTAGMLLMSGYITRLSLSSRYL